MSTIDVQGTCDPAFKPVRDAFAENFASRGDVGAGVSVIADGRTVVDIYGGDAAPGIPWERTSLVNIWSSTKAVVALALQMLVDRGQVDVDAPVARYWPEFATGSKEGLPLRYLLSHRAGLCGLREPVTVEDLEKWDKITALLAAMEPWWPPGEVSGYHALTYGYLVGEVIRRVSGKTPGRFVADEIAGPLGADIHIGLGPAEVARAARLEMEEPAEGTDVAAMFENLTPAAIATLTNPPMAAPKAAEIANRDSWRRAEIPAANGHATALGLATVHAVMAFGGRHGHVALLSKSGVERIREGQGRGPDLVLSAGMAGAEMEFGLGVILSGPEGAYGPNPAAFGHDGYGGSFGMADPEAHLAIGYVMNHMGVALAGDPRKIALIDAAYGVL